MPAVAGVAHPAGRSRVCPDRHRSADQPVADPTVSEFGCQNARIWKQPLAVVVDSKLNTTIGVYPDGDVDGFLGSSETCKVPGVV